jgi:hypothetical protein
MVWREPWNAQENQGWSHRLFSHPELTNQNNLEFTLRMQEFVELCRQRKVPEAIVYSRKNLAPWAATHLIELQQAMTLLAFGEKSGVAVYRVSRTLGKIIAPLIL